MHRMLNALFCLLAMLAVALSSIDAARAQTSTSTSTSTSTLSAATPVQRCEALTGSQFISIPSAPTWVIRATHHAATDGKRAYCEVEGYVNPTVNFGIALPANDWNGKFIVRGCGGSCGVVALDFACSRHLRDGYACLHTDMGHRSDQIDNNWVADNLQGLVDFGYRATHVATVAGKAIAKAYYNDAPHRAYFFGCSTGGRQAMVEAQRFPDDFDGIIAIAPVGMAGFGQTPVASPTDINRNAKGEAILTDLQVPLIYKAVMAKCDLNDGVRDHLIDPRDCKFDPAELQCKADGKSDPRNCLTAEQVEVTRKFYARGAALGSELNWINNWTAKPGPPEQFVQTRGDPAVIDTLNNAGNPDLRAFRDHGGKLIMVHGYTDLIVPPGPMVDYYDLTTRTMGGLQATQQFVRLFLIPGMDHCSGGDGAWAVSYVPLLDDWVERGKAPNSIVGIHPKLGAPLDYFGIDVPLLKPEQMEFSRTYFPYPMKAYYSGQGDTTLATSYKPALQPQRHSTPADKAGMSVDSATLARELMTIVHETEQTYTASGLPSKNIADRISKALRLKLYGSQLPNGVVMSALMMVRDAGLSTIAMNGLSTVLAEYSP